MSSAKSARWWTIAGIVIVLYSFVPLLWMISLAFKPPSDIVSGTPQFLPSTFTLDNFAQIFSNPLFTRALINSIGIAVIATFISLLLLAGLVQVTEDMQEAAKVDGATAWQRLWKITLPNMKAAIMVALLFRTLDAWRIFDNPYVMTAGANNTETISFLAYRQNVTLVNLGMGSAVSVLLFLTVVLIAWIFIKVFKTDLSQVRGDQ